ncbi:MAG: hypothetical protein ACP5HG_08900 [Anaerolineae bacterium]
MALASSTVWRSPVLLVGGSAGCLVAPPTFYLCLDDATETEILDALPPDDVIVFICQDAALDDSQKGDLS